jgi:hypothetical protein
MKASRICAGLVIATLSFSAMAKDPCGTELCLSNLTVAMDAQGCQEHIDGFFSIIKYKHDKFSPSKTLKARKSYLEQCESGNDSDKTRILAKYGMILKP